MSMTGVISVVVTPKDNPKSNPPCYRKSQDLIKIRGRVRAIWTGKQQLLLRLVKEPGFMHGGK